MSTGRRPSTSSALGEIPWTEMGGAVLLHQANEHNGVTCQRYMWRGVARSMAARSEVLMQSRLLHEPTEKDTPTTEGETDTMISS